MSDTNKKTIEEDILKEIEEGDIVPTLVQKVKNGDMEAFENLYVRSYSTIYRTLKLMLCDEDAIQDVIQETYLKSLNKINQLQEEDTYVSWVKRIAINTAKNYIRKEKNISEIEREASIRNSREYIQNERNNNLPEVLVEQQETIQVLERILNELDENQRMAVTLYYYEERSVKEIADFLSCSVDTVKSRLYYARKNIRKAIKKLEEKGTFFYSFIPIFYLRLLFKNVAENPAQICTNKEIKSIQSKESMASTFGSAAAEQVSEKVLAAGILALMVCVGIGYSGTHYRERKLQKQEIHELLMDTEVESTKSEDSQSPEKSDMEIKVQKEKDSKDVDGAIATTPTPVPTAVPPQENEPVMNNGNTPEQQETSRNVENERVETSTDSEEEQQTGTTEEHSHAWVEKKETVHHEASGHYETKVVQEAYDEPVYEYRIFCNICGADITTSTDEHTTAHGDPQRNYSSQNVQNGSIHHDAVTEQVWVEEPAYDETITVGKVCSICGEEQ